MLDEVLLQLKTQVCSLSVLVNPPLVLDIPVVAMAAKNAYNQLRLVGKV